MNQTPKFIQPKILVIEGLYSDTVDIVDAAGGDGYEVYAGNLAEIERALETDEYHGMILTGGSDVDPRLYGEKPHKETYGVDHVRDTAEWVALDYAMKAGIPVLGICRGSQIMCAFRGGKLKQHIEGHRGGTHPVLAQKDARTFKRAINARSMDVISLHHQCVRRPGKGMRIAAKAMDGTPEAIESKDGLWLGVQFHPEMAAWSNGNAFAIFQWLVRKAAEHAGGQAAVTRFREVRKAYKEELARKAAKKYWQGQATSCTTPNPKNRPAGTRTYAGSDEEIPNGDYFMCSKCAMLFDYQTDRDDHMRYICGEEPLPGTEVFESEGTELTGTEYLEARYPELLPPPDSEAWDDPDEEAAKEFASVQDALAYRRGMIH